jgi:hypothetical protein
MEGIVLIEEERDLTSEEYLQDLERVAQELEQMVKDKISGSAVLLEDEFYEV